MYPKEATFIGVEQEVYNNFCKLTKDDKRIKNVIIHYDAKYSKTDQLYGTLTIEEFPGYVDDYDYALCKLLSVMNSKN